MGSESHAILLPRKRPRRQDTASDAAKLGPPDAAKRRATDSEPTTPSNDVGSDVGSDAASNEASDADSDADSDTGSQSRRQPRSQAEIGAPRRRIGKTVLRSSDSESGSDSDSESGSGSDGDGDGSSQEQIGSVKTETEAEAEEAKTEAAQTRPPKADIPKWIVASRLAALEQKTRSDVGDLVESLTKGYAQPKALKSAQLCVARLSGINTALPGEADGRHSSRITSVGAFGSTIFTAGLDRGLVFYAAASSTTGDRTQTQLSATHKVLIGDLPVKSANWLASGKVLCQGARSLVLVDPEAPERHVSVASCSRKHWLGDEYLEQSSIPRGQLEDANTFAVSDSLGRIFLLDLRQSLPTRTVRGDGSPLADFGFHAKGLFSATKEGTLYHWDARRGACVGRWTDEGSCTSRLSSGPGVLVTGTTSGFVNIYDVEDVLQKCGSGRASSIRPVKACGNLKTEITCAASVAVSGSGAVFGSTLANQSPVVSVVASNRKNECLRIIEGFPDPDTDNGVNYRVHADFPGPRKTGIVGRISALAVATGAASLLLVGTDQGKLHGYTLTR